MIELNQDELIFKFPHVHRGAECSIDFQRTLRIPDDNNEYPLPPGLGNFPIHHVDDYSQNLPASWESRGGVFLPMYQAEALWINFHSAYPCAIKVAAGKINAVTGKDWNNGKLKKTQNYAVIPEQPWLDGFNVTDDLIRQFVATPLGQGHTAEEQLTGKSEYGGLQIIVYPMKRSFFMEHVGLRAIDCEFIAQGIVCQEHYVEDPSMGMAPGGLMRQEIEKDPYGLKAWDQENGLRLFVHLANSKNYEDITGNEPPQKPVTAKDYTDAGLPWFEHYSESKVPGAEKLSTLDRLAASSIKRGHRALEDNKSVTPRVVMPIKNGSNNS